MAKKIFSYKGKSLEELQKLSTAEFLQLTTSRVRRSLSRPLPETHKKLVQRVRKGGEKAIRTHCRDMVILPEFIGKTFAIYNGKEFVNINIEPEMVGHYLGEFALSRKKVQHSSPGMGATRASKYVSLK
jgi:small subunit ribosomal protein S19